MNGRIELAAIPVPTGLSPSWRRTGLVGCLLAYGLLSSACSAEQGEGVDGQIGAASEAPVAASSVNPDVPAIPAAETMSKPELPTDAPPDPDGQFASAVAARDAATGLSTALAPDPTPDAPDTANDAAHANVPSGANEPLAGGAVDQAGGLDGVNEVDRGDVADAGAAADASATLRLAQPLLLASAELGGDNVVSSSASLVQALLLARAGAAGDTLIAFDQMLFGGKPPLSLEGERLEPADGSRGVTLTIANAAWLAKDLPVAADYAPALEKMGSPLQRIDFGSASTLKTINDWFAERTGGKIQGMLERLEPDTRFLLANALHFRGDWNEPFDPKATSAGPFNGADEVHYMRADRLISYTEYDGARAIRLGFRDLRHAMLVILPDGDPLDWLRAHPDALAKAVTGPIGPRMVDVRLPRFEIAGGGELAQALQQMGLQRAFGPEADFSALSAEQTRLGSVVHRATLSVDETGAEASAATAVTGTRNARPVSIEFHVDRPFIAVVLDRERQLPIVTAIVRKP